MKNNMTGRIIINKHNSDLDNFYESKFKIDLNRVAFIFVIIFIFFYYIQQESFTYLQKLFKIIHIK